MSFPGRIEQADPGRVSPLILCDRLIRLAEEADHAGLSRAARRLVNLANAMFDDPPPPARRPPALRGRG